MKVMSEWNVLEFARSFNISSCQFSLKAPKLSRYFQNVPQSQTLANSSQFYEHANFSSGLILMLKKCIRLLMRCLFLSILFFQKCIFKNLTLLLHLCIVSPCFFLTKIFNIFCILIGPSFDCMATLYAKCASQPRLCSQRKCVLTDVSSGLDEMYAQITVEFSPLFSQLSQRVDKFRIWGI